MDGARSRAVDIPSSRPECLFFRATPGWLWPRIEYCLLYILPTHVSAIKRGHVFYVPFCQCVSFCENKDSVTLLVRAYYYGNSLYVIWWYAEFALTLLRRAPLPIATSSTHILLLATRKEDRKHWTSERASRLISCTTARAWRSDRVD